MGMGNGYLYYNNINCIILYSSLHWRECGAGHWDFDFYRDEDKWLIGRYIIIIIRYPEEVKLHNTLIILYDRGATRIFLKGGIHTC